MEYVTQSIINYIESNSQNALLIEGKWGVGKTYFINEKIFPLLENKNRYDIIYVSLYGHDSLDSLRKTIEHEILGNQEIIKSVISTAKEFENDYIKGIGSIFDFALTYRNRKKIIQYTNNIILFIDDLERLSSNININDCLGLISSEFIEKLRCKVVFIGNIKEIHSENLEQFYLIKEKVIDKTLLFEPLSKNIIQEIIESEDNKFISENHEYVIEVLTFFFKTINVRTLQSILLNFNYFERLINEFGINEEHMVKIKKSMFLNIMVLTQEYKEGNITADSIKDYVFDGRYVQLNNASELKRLLGLSHDSSENDDMDGTNEKETIKEKYHDKIQLFDDNIFYFSGVSDYIMHGYYEKNMFIESYEKWKSLYFPDKDFSNYKLLYEFRDMSESELFQRQKETVSNLNRKNLTFDDLLRIYKLYLEFKYMGLLLINHSDLNIIESKIYDCSTLEDIRSTETLIQMFRENQYEEIKCLEKNLKWLRSEYEFEQLSILIESIFNNDLSCISEYENTIYASQIFELIDINIINKFILIKNSKAHNLMRYIKRHNFDKKKFESEIKRILFDLKEGNLEHMDKVDKFKLKQLIEELEK